MTQAQQMNGHKEVMLYNDDCRNILRNMPDNSVDLIATDPPYFIDGMDNKWSHKNLRRRESDKSSQTSSISGMPSSMKFDPNQGRKLQLFFNEVAPHLFRVLKPGGYIAAFAQPRLYHRLVVALEDAGFEIRDMLIWQHKGGQGKAFKFDRMVRTSKTIPDSKKESIIANMAGRKTPQLRPKFEPFVLGQKPREGTFVDNWTKWNTGLLQLEFDGRQQSTVFQYDKPNLRKKYDHMTIKPQALLERIVEMCTLKGQVVLDPFMGSGTTGVAARIKDRMFIGIDVDNVSFLHAKERLEENRL